LSLEKQQNGNVKYVVYCTGLSKERAKISFWRLMMSIVRGYLLNTEDCLHGLSAARRNLQNIKFSV